MSQSNLNTAEIPLGSAHSSSSTLQNSNKDSSRSQHASLDGGLHKSGPGFRKRIVPQHPLSSAATATSSSTASAIPYRSRINPQLIYRDYYNLKKGPVSMGSRIRNFILMTCLIAFPFCIFVLPILWHQPSYLGHSRMIVSILIPDYESQDSTASHFLESVLTNLYNSMDVDDALYIITPSASNKLEIPSFLKQWMHDKSASIPTVKILHPKESQGGFTFTSCALVAMEEAQRWSEGEHPELDGDSNTISERSILDEESLEIFETRMILASSNAVIQGGSLVPPYADLASTIHALVSASFEYPDSVLSTIGGNWRSYFRQVKFLNPFPSLLNQFPNIVLHHHDGSLFGISSSPKVDVVDSTHGILAFRLGTLAKHASKMEERMSTLEEKNNRMVDVPLAEHVVWSGILASLNTTQRIIPFPRQQRTIKLGKSSNSTALNSLGPANVVTPVYTQKHWMTTAHLLQHQWGIWQEFFFWDWASLSVEQREAIDCEGQYEPDCGDVNDVTDYRKGYCRPNTEYCGADVSGILDEMTDASNLSS